MQIRRATQDDARQAAVTAVAAFGDDPVMRWLHPDDDVYFQPGGVALRGAIDRWLVHDEVWCTDDAAAIAAWIPPGRPEIAVEPDPRAAAPSPEMLARLEILGALMAEHTPAEPHWYLQLLATHPDWQRTGRGGHLMADMFERADAEGLPCWLETETLVNVAYYQRHGFEVQAEFDIPTGEHQHRFSSFGGDPATEVGPHMWGMYRAPR